MMQAAIRLLHFDDLDKLTYSVFPNNPPPYAVLSHTWFANNNDEFLFEDLVSGMGRTKPGYVKILFCKRQAKRDKLRYFWIDTCCIDKWNARELANSINSMYRWYKSAARCYALLEDVCTETAVARPYRRSPRLSVNATRKHSQGQVRLRRSQWKVSFYSSRWFKRGWTLQELIAPLSVEFFSKEGLRLGSKRSLELLIHEITKIPIPVLRGDPLDDFSVQERLVWTQGRVTTHLEDLSYSLVGIFGVSMEFQYGEGADQARRRLIEAIEKGGCYVDNLFMNSICASIY